MQIKLLFILLFSIICFSSFFVDAKKKGVGKIKLHKAHSGHKGHKAHVHHVHKAHGHKGHKGHKGHGHKGHKSHHVHKAHKAKHVHHAGAHHHSKHHKKHKSPALIQSTTPVPLYSPPFVGIDNGQLPTDSQVELIMDWLAKIGSTIDVFLRLQGTYPEGSKEQRQLIKNVYPPLRVLLESQHAYDFKTGQLQ